MLFNTQSISGSLEISGSYNVDQLIVKGGVKVRGQLDLVLDGGVNFISSSYMNRIHGDIENNFKSYLNTFSGSTEFTGSVKITGSLTVSGSINNNVNTILGTITGSYTTSSIDLSKSNIHNIQLMDSSLNVFQFQNIKPGLSSTIFVRTSGSSTVSLPETTTYTQGGTQYTPSTGSVIDLLKVYTFDTGSVIIDIVKNFSAIPSSAFDVNAAAYMSAVTAAGGTLTSPNQTAINNLFLSLKSNSLYSKLYAMYPFTGGIAASNKFNALNPVDTDGAFRITFSGGWTHTTSGATANGTNSLGNTHCNSITTLTDFNKSYILYQSQTAPNGSGWEGMWDTGPSGVFGINLQTGGQLGLGLNFLSGGLGIPSPYKNSYIASIRSSTDKKLYVNGTQFYSRTNADPAYTGTLKYYIGCMNEKGSPNYYNNYIYNFHALGQGLTAGEAATLNTIINTYITAMGR